MLTSGYRPGKKGQDNTTFGTKKHNELDKSFFSMHNARMSYAAQFTLSSGTTRFVRSYAKIDLTLDVLERRADNYHGLATVMQTVDLYDTLCLTTTADGSVHIICTRPNSTVPTTWPLVQRKLYANASLFHKGLSSNCKSASPWLRD